MSPLQRSDFHTRESRRNILQNEFGFYCQCNLCSEPNILNLRQNDLDRRNLLDIEQKWIHLGQDPFKVIIWISTIIRCRIFLYLCLLSFTQNEREIYMNPVSSHDLIYLFCKTKLSCKVHKYLHKPCNHRKSNHPIVDWNIQGDPYLCNLGTNANNFGDLQYYLLFPNWYNSKERHFANANCPPKRIYRYLYLIIVIKWVF